MKKQTNKQNDHFLQYLIFLFLFLIIPLSLLSLFLFLLLLLFRLLILRLFLRFLPRFLLLPRLLLLSHSCLTQIELSPDGSGTLRLLEVYSYRIHRVFSDTVSYHNIQPSMAQQTTCYRVEVRSFYRVYN